MLSLLSSSLHSTDESKVYFQLFFLSIGRLSKNGNERYFDILTPVKKDRIEVWLVVGFRCTSRSCRSGGCCLYKLTHSTQITVGTLLPSPYSFQKKSLSRNLSLSLSQRFSLLLCMEEQVGSSRSCSRSKIHAHAGALWTPLPLLHLPVSLCFFLSRIKPLKQTIFQSSKS